MKELILKIKSLKLDDGTFRSIGNDKAIDKVLNLILEQENKTFDPKDLGFKESRKSMKILVLSLIL